MKRSHLRQRKSNIEWLHDNGYTRNSDGSYGGEEKPYLSLIGKVWHCQGSSAEDRDTLASGATPAQAVVNWQVCVKRAVEDLQAVALRLLQRADKASPKG